mmetsp:Transcript_2721/g.7985  ORF Transcript_2721/g.7985 Transcript_2721/m.7985 type:complete len:360 (+) Transcript_2721:126-1205(+)
MNDGFDDPATAKGQPIVEGKPSLFQRLFCIRGCPCYAVYCIGVPVILIALILVATFSYLASEADSPPTIPEAVNAASNTIALEVDIAFDGDGLSAYMDGINDEDSVIHKEWTRGIEKVVGLDAEGAAAEEDASRRLLQEEQGRRLQNDKVLRVLTRVGIGEDDDDEDFIRFTEQEKEDINYLGEIVERAISRLGFNTSVDIDNVKASATRTVQCNVTKPFNNNWCGGAVNRLLKTPEVQRQLDLDSLLPACKTLGEGVSPVAYVGRSDTLVGRAICKLDTTPASYTCRLERLFQGSLTVINNALLAYRLDACTLSLHDIKCFSYGKDEIDRCEGRCILTRDRFNDNKPRVFCASKLRKV